MIIMWQSRVINAFLYKMQNSKYYNNVWIDHNSCFTLLQTCTNVSPKLHNKSTDNVFPSYEESNIVNVDSHNVPQEEQVLYSFAFKLHNMQQEMEKVKEFVHMKMSFHQIRFIDHKLVYF
jgi:hypothetical protein